MTAAVEPFTIEVPQPDLDDLRDRLARTRFTAPTPGDPWAAGIPPAYLRELVDYWATTYDWRAQERRLNGLPQFRVDLDGQSVHFVHVAGKREQGAPPLPLILTHGWPSAFIEFQELIPLLTDPAAHGADPADAFDVVVPSLPGHLFSDLPPDGPVTRPRIADAWVRLMDVLGFERFAAYGGDIGADVTNWLAIRHPDRLVGIHLLHPKLPTPGSDGGPNTPAEQAYLDFRLVDDELDGGYSAIQGTRPDTIAAALADSPAGLAAWILDKWRAWSDCHGDLESRFRRDDLLTLVSLYWLTDSIGSSFRTYFDYDANPPRPLITVPVGVTLGIEDKDYPRELADRSYSDIRHWRDATAGGHFMPLEEPDLLAAELRTFFRPLRR
jgi:pimeloyl-ACP methyl ester carboxylesterase